MAATGLRPPTPPAADTACRRPRASRTSQPRASTRRPVRAARHVARLLIGLRLPVRGRTATDARDVHQWHSVQYGRGIAVPVQVEGRLMALQGLSVKITQFVGPRVTTPESWLP